MCILNAMADGSVPAWGIEQVHGVEVISRGVRLEMANVIGGVARDSLTPAAPAVLVDA